MALEQRVELVARTAEASYNWSATHSVSLSDMQTQLLTDQGNIEAIKRDAASRTTHQQVIEYIERYVRSLFPGLFASEMRRWWNNWTTWPKGGLPVDPVLVNFTYARITRWMKAYDRQAAAGVADSVGPWTYPTE